MTRDRTHADKITIINTLPHHAEGICRIVRRAFMVDVDEPCEDCMQPADIIAQIEAFPEGQFVAIVGDGETLRIVGMAATMRTSYPPDADARPWLDAIGGLQMQNHEPDGEWLYGVEMAVAPDFQGRGIGTRLYRARFNLVRRLNLRGWYAVGMLMGYHAVQHQMSVREYGDRVIRRELRDPTVTMQMNRGFRARYVVEDYLDEPPAGDAGILIVWNNPQFQE